jgi:hypothetical protein
MTGTFFAIRTAVVQTWLSQKIASYLSEEMGTRVEVGGVEIDLWSRLVLKNLYIEDIEADTLAFIPELRLNKYHLDRTSGLLTIDGASLYSPYFRLARLHSDSLLNISVLSKYINSLSTPEDTSGTTFKIREIILVDGTFLFDNMLRQQDTLLSTDWNHLKMSGINLNLKNFAFQGDSLDARIEHLSMVERKGMDLRALSADLHAKPTGIFLKNASIETGRSYLRGDLAFKYESIDDLNDFEQKVKMDHNLKRSKIQLADIAWFSHDLEGIEKEIFISGNIRGKVSKLRGKNIEIKFDRSSYFMGNFSMDGLPNMDQTFIDLDVKDLTSNKTELERLPIPPFTGGEKLILPENLSALGQIHFKGKFTGFLNDFVSYGQFTTDIGTITSDLALRKDTSINDYVYSGNIGSKSFNLGKFYPGSKLGVLNSNLSIAGQGFSLERADAKITGEVQSIRYDGYNCTNIVADGHLSKNFFEGNVSITDPNVIMDFNGKLDFTGKKPSLDFVADIAHVDLKEIGLLTDKNYSSVSGTISLSSEYFDIKNFSGDIYCEDLVFCTEDSDYFIGELHLNADRSGIPKITLTSKVADGELIGKYDLEGIEHTFLSILSNVVPSFRPPIAKHSAQDFSINLIIKDFSEISEIFIPELKIAPGTRIDFTVDENASFFEGILTSDSISYGSNHLYGVTFDTSPEENSMFITMSTDKLLLANHLEFDELFIDARTDRDTVFTAISWGNDSTTVHSGDINGMLTVHSSTNVNFLMNESSMRVFDDRWTFQKGANIALDSNYVDIRGFRMSNEAQIIRINGGISDNPSTRLDLEMVALDVSSVNAFIPGGDTKLYGELTGMASIRDVYKHVIFTSDLVLSDFAINDYKVGDVCLESTWDNLKQQLNVDGEIQKGDISPLLFAGYYEPKNETSPLNLLAKLNDFELAFLNEFLSDEVLSLSGYANGSISVTGKPDAPQLEGLILPKDAGVYIKYLNTKYQIMEPCGLYPDMITFDAIDIKDQEGNVGLLTGTIIHENFAEWNFDVNIDMERPLLAMNTNVFMNPLYYGKAYTTGRVSIFGLAEQLEFDINLKSARGTRLAMPMGETGELTFENFIRFVDVDQPVVDEEIDLSGIKMRFELEITPDAEFQIIFDEAIGDVITGRGKGNIMMDISNLSSFRMFGTVEVLEGNYLFTLKNLFSKDFDLRPGGTISWYGDPFEADLDLETIYRVNASLADVIPESAASGQRVPVNLIMGLHGKLFNPTIDFDIELPSSDEVTKSRIASVISTENEKNRQAFALLVMRRFLAPPNITKTQASSNAALENTSEFISSQLSNWLSQLSDDFNLGVNYRPGSEISNQELEVIIGTQLFNNKLIVMGNFGVSSGTSASQNPSNLIGDIRLEYKLTPEGKLRLVVYSESNDYRLASTQQSPYVQGVGLVLQEEFDNWDQLACEFRNLLKKQKDRVNCFQGAL